MPTLMSLLSLFISSLSFFPLSPNFYDSFSLCDSLKKAIKASFSSFFPPSAEQMNCARIFRVLRRFECPIEDLRCRASQAKVESIACFLRKFDEIFCGN
jgi:hypothetical protein